MQRRPYDRCEATESSLRSLIPLPNVLPGKYQCCLSRGSDPLKPNVSAAFDYFNQAKNNLYILTCT